MSNISINMDMLSRYVHFYPEIVFKSKSKYIKKMNLGLDPKT